MARRSTSILDDLMDIAEAFPWWIGLLMTIGSYFLFHSLSVMDINSFEPESKKWIPGIKIAAFGLKILVPLALGAGTLLSAYNQWRRSNIFKSQTSIDSIRALSWQQFEQLISEAFRQKGYQVLETEDGPDGGIDLKLFKDGRKIYVQCKHWKTNKVGVDNVRELNGVVAGRGAYSGILITSGIFTVEAVEESSNYPIELINGDKLRTLIPHLDQPQAPETTVEKSPSCPRCGNSMVKRTAKRGKSAGNDFWGCSTYPKCKGSISI